MMDIVLLYPMSLKTSSIHIVSSAGGNHTALEILDRPQSRDFYRTRGKELMSLGESYHIEQSGFIILSQSHLEMSGDQFAPNGVQSAALLLSKYLGLHEFRFSSSGIEHQVKALIEERDLDCAYVQCDFINLPRSISMHQLSAGEQVFLVELGGVTHVLIHGMPPEDPIAFSAYHNQIVHELDLNTRRSVGVCWVSNGPHTIDLHAFMWVRLIDSYVYETSCASGSIAASFALGCEFVRQPSGKTIRIQHDRSLTSIGCEIKLIHSLAKTDMLASAGA